MNRQLIRAMGVWLICSMLALAGCSQSDGEQAHDAQTELDQANQNLKDAQAQVDKAKAKAGDSADTSAADDAKDEKQDEADQKIADAQTAKEAADKKLADARADRQQAAKRQASARGKSDKTTQQARSTRREQAKSNNQPVCNDCGTVSSVTPVTRNAEHGSGVGAVAGGVAGGVVGSQIGHGTGKTIAQIAGVLGGAYAGNAAEKHVRKVTVYQVNVAMDAGGSRSVTVDKQAGVSTGTRVHVQGNNLVLMR